MKYLPLIGFLITTSFVAGLMMGSTTIPKMTEWWQPLIVVAVTLVCLAALLTGLLIAINSKHP